MQLIDIPGWAEGAYGFSKEDISSGLPNGKARRSQTTGLGDKLWFDSATGGIGYEFMPVALGGVQLWNPVIRVAGRKNIVETPMVEGDGSVKEIIGLDDFVINIKGIIKRKDGLWPDDELAELIEMYKVNEAIPITSAVTGRFLNGNEYVVITNFNLPETPGFVESISYEIECVSDIPFVLELE